jgi:hypothetical protein
MKLRRAPHRANGKGCKDYAGHKNIYEQLVDCTETVQSGELY